MSSPSTSPSPGDIFLNGLVTLAVQVLGGQKTDLPSWFLENCMKTIHELATAEPALLIDHVNTSSTRGECLRHQDTTGRYATDPVFYRFIKDELATSASQGPSPGHRALYLIMLERQENPLEVRGFLSAYVHSLARDAGANLVTLDISDVANLAEHYSRSLKIDNWKEKDGICPGILREQYDPNHYDKLGDNLSKSFWIPFREIITAPYYKSTLVRAAFFSKRVILHIPGAQAFTKELVGRNVLRHLARVIRDNIFDLAVTVILTDSENSQCLSKPDCGHSHHTDPLDVVELVELDEIGDVFYVFPEETTSLGEVLRSDARREQHLKLVDHLQKAIRKLRAVQCGDEEEINPLLLPYSDLGVLLYTETGGFMAEAQMIYLAQCLTAVSDWSDSKQIHRAIKESGEIQIMLESWSTEAGRTSNENKLFEADTEQDFARKAQTQVMMKKANPCNEFERRVLDLVVDIGGLEDTWSNIEIDPDLRKSIVQMVDLCRSSPSGNYGILQRASSKGAILYGPPGTGKTHLARVLAKESNSTMINVSAAEIMQKYVGESEKFIKALFAIGRKVAPSIIFLDEADALLRQRKSEDQPWHRSMMSQFLQDSDGLKREKNPPFMLLATNNPQDLDPAVLRRIPGRLYLGMPHQEARERLFKMFLRGEHLSPALDIRQLAGMTIGYTGSDIYTLCVNTALICEDEVLTMSTDGFKGVKRILMLSHFKTAMKRSGPTVHPTTLHKFRRFAHDYHPAAESKIMAEERVGDPDADLLEDEIEKRERTVVAAAERGKPLSKMADHKGSNSRTLAYMEYYQPLNPLRNEIRLLKIKNSGWTTGGVECELEIVSLLRHPRFTALSYVWGDPTSKEDIIMHGSMWPVTRNLARALRTMRHHWTEHFPDRDWSEFRVWVDAVCINQDNLSFCCV
ncbi:hypothetical protein HD806DRAFT_533979 [Xylariaceae sp. AK1471]|nr:hypothetical protein HD806DRAFT_533979 [Xylariaceae sp. AK1471]